MGPFDALVERLQQIHQEIDQSGGLEPDAPVFQRLSATVAELKEAVSHSIEALKTEALAAAAEMHDQAAKMEAEQQGEAAVEELPHPWEDHQGLSDDQVQEMIARLVEAALPPDPQPG